MDEKQKIATTIYRPKGQPRAIFQISHGMAEHRLRYAEFAQNLAQLGLVVVTSDHRGHGGSAASPEELGYFNKHKGWQKCVNDLYELMIQVKQEYPDVPVILFGHSMGSIMARSFVKRYDALLNGLILCGAPNYNPAASAGRIAAKSIIALKGDHYRSKLLDQLVQGSFNKQIPNPRTPLDWLSKNPDNVDAYIADPLCGFRFTASAFDDMFYGIQDMHDLMRWNLKNPKLPILFIAGGDDPVTGGRKGLESSAATLREAGYDDIEMRVFKGLRHELLNEKEKDQVVAEILDWTARKIGGCADLRTEQADQ